MNSHQSNKKPVITMVHPLPPAPSGQALQIISALSNQENHKLHVQAIRARDEALSASIDSYGHLCRELAQILVGSDRPRQMMEQLDAAAMQAWQDSDPKSVQKLQQDERLWIPFGQMAGLVLKNALLHPPTTLTPPSTQSSSEQQDQRSFATTFSLQPPHADHVKELLLQYGLRCQHRALRNVASTVIATTAVSHDTVQPHLYVQNWPQLVPTLLQMLQQTQQPPSQQGEYAIEGALTTIHMIMEEGPAELSSEELDNLVPVMISFLQPHCPNRCKTISLQALNTCLTDEMMPSALVLHFDQYMTALSQLASSETASTVRQWVCRTLVTLLQERTEFIIQHMPAIALFMLSATADRAHEKTVALEACEFWLAFANLETEAQLGDAVLNLLPQLIPVLLDNMVYTAEQQAELNAQNELDLELHGNVATTHNLRPVFHRSRNKHGGNDGAVINNGDDDESSDGYAQDDEGDGDYDDDEEGNEWTLRKCAAASLDSLANLYGADPVLPSLLPALEHGLASQNAWVQEACILALGAVAEGCRDAMSAHLPALHPYLRNLLATPETSANGDTNVALPQVKCIAAWTMGRYASWVVEQVQSGGNGDLLAELSQIFLARLTRDRNRKVQIACAASFGVLLEAAGDLMVPYLEHVYRGLVAALDRFQGRSLVMLLDVFGIMAESCGPAIAESHLLSMYMPALIQMWNTMASSDPSDRVLLPLMEAIASIAATSGTAFAPFAPESFNNAMGIIEAVRLELASTDDFKVENEEEVDPIICATDLIDGLVEGLGCSFPDLLASSTRYRPHFLSVVLALCQHDIGGVRMSALALVGDLTRQCPVVLEAALPSIISEVLASMDPVSPMVCTNAVWAMGEICAKCRGGNPAVLEPFAPTLMQNLIALLMGNNINGNGRGSLATHGVPANAAACVGRLALVHANFVAPELSRFFNGWCEGMAQIHDADERRDAYRGLVAAVYANPHGALEQQQQQPPGTTSSTSSPALVAIASLLYAVLSWHIPSHVPHDAVKHAISSYNFTAFPATEAELGNALRQLLHDMKAAVGDNVWRQVSADLPVNVRRLLREAYGL